MHILLEKCKYIKLINQTIYIHIFFSRGFWILIVAILNYDIKSRKLCFILAKYIKIHKFFYMATRELKKKTYNS